MVWNISFLDLATKALAESLAPSNEIFFLIYNKNMLMGVDAPWAIKYLLPLALFPLPWIMAKKLNLTKTQGFYMLYAGMVGNMMGRMTDQGVIDFINCQYFVCNLADVFQWVGIALIYKQIFKKPILVKQ